MGSLRSRARATVLVVDDDEGFTEMMQQSLTRLNYTGATCNDPLEALNLFASMPDRFDVVIVDEIMPGMKGTDLTIRLLQIKDDLPVILLTGHGDIIPLDTVRASGVRTVLSKPVLREDLRAALDKVLVKRG
jgi:CheY-like chemotaxis protein